MAQPREKHTSTKSRTLTAAEIDALEKVEIRRCANPECLKQIPRAKMKHNPTYCSRSCRSRHTQIRHGKCARSGCENYRPTAKSMFCSHACYQMTVFIPRRQCARAGCENTVKWARAIYCSTACRDLCVDLNEMSKRGTAVIRAYKQQTGHGFHAQKIASTVSRNNKLKPPRAKVHREDRAYGYRIFFDPDGLGGYRATVPDVAGIIAHHQTKKGAMIEVKRMMRNAGIEPVPGKWLRNV